MQYLIRYYTPSLKAKAESLSLFLNKNHSSKLVDHTNVQISDFNIPIGSIPLSIDLFLSIKFNIDYFKVSRIFSTDGEVVDRFFGEHKQNKLYHIIDTDIVTGNNMSKAKQLTQAETSSYLIKTSPIEDLIDIEDLVFENSMLQGGKKCSYLLNENFFSLRTSLPKEYYKQIKELIGV